MKQGNSIINFVIILLAAALTAYMGFYVWDTFNTPYTTTVAYSYTLNDSLNVNGLIVRREQVLPAQSGIVDLVRGEGEKVAKGDRVALVYQNTQAQQSQSEQETLAREKEALEFALLQGDDVVSAAHLDEDILQSLVALRSAVALQDFSSLEDQALSVKSSVLKRDYTFGGSSGEDLRARLQTLNSQLSALKSQSAGATSRVTAPVSGVFSVLVDGFEGLTPQQLLETEDRMALSTLLSGDAQPVEANAMGKLITSSQWYFAANLSLEEAGRLIEGRTVTVRFSGDFSRDVSMKVERIVVDGSGAVVVLSTHDYLSQTTLLRRQTVELIFSSAEGIRIPKASLRMETETVQKEDSSETEEVNLFGVYAVLNGRAVFKEAEILSEGSDFYVVRAANDGKNALRPGDEIVLRGTGVYNGKLMEF
ncbi:MAG: hypothetical protein IKK44_05065 [Clostridium sp.]|nr:hypothetical protein [Clostridium sp.]